MMRSFLCGLVGAAILLGPSAATACPPPPPPPDFSREAGESDTAFDVRIKALKDAAAEQAATRSREEARRRESWLSEQRKAWTDAAYVVLASISDSAPRSDGNGRVTYRIDRQLKGERRVGKLQRDLYMRPLTSCGGYDAGIDGGADGRFLIFLTNRKPGLLTEKQIIPVQYIDEPKLKALIELPAKSAR